MKQDLEYTTQEIKENMLAIEKQIIKLIASLPKIKQADVQLEHPANSDHGDYSTNIAMKLFSKLALEQLQSMNLDSPRDLAYALVAQLDDKLATQPDLSKFIKKIEVAGSGFINLYLSDQFFIDSLLTSISQKNYGSSEIAKGKVWELEHTSPNPNKAMHLGHLRNNLVGMTLGRLWEAIGIRVIYEEMDNNRGIAIAKLMWGFLKFARIDKKTPVEISHWIDHPEKWQTPDDLKLRPDRFVDGLYVKGSTDFEQDKQVEQTVRQMVVDWEANDDNTRQLWQHVLNYSYLGQQLTLKRLGNCWDHVWHEHEHYHLGKEMVFEGLEKGIFVKLIDGAVATNLAKFDLPDTIIQKSDGTSLYITQDIALNKLKINKNHADKYHWVVGPEQKLALAQMFAICEQFGFVKRSDLVHISYGYMSIKGQGKMSSRAGNVLYIDDLLDLAKERAKALIKDGSLSDDQKNELSEKIGVGAVKYAILKVGRAVDMAFDIDSALSLEGNSGPYLQYTFARASSILRKAEILSQQLEKTLTDALETQFNDLQHSLSQTDDKGLLKLIYQYPTIVQSAALNSEPSTLATYLYQLAQAFNSFYNQQQVLVDEQLLKQYRLGLVAAVIKVLGSGLTLLGIEPLSKM